MSTALEEAIVSGDNSIPKNVPSDSNSVTYEEVDREMTAKAKEDIKSSVHAAVQKEVNRRNGVVVEDSPAARRKMEEVKQLVQTFHEKVANYPKHMSYEGSMVLCVLLSMKKVAAVGMRNIPSVDQTLIRSLLPKDVEVSGFDVKFDDNKDFILIFNPHDNSDLTLTLFNTVAHPRPCDITSTDGIDVVPVEEDGEVVKVGGRILVDKRTVRTILGQPCKDSTPPQAVEEQYKKQQPSVNRNAYEIRADVLQMAIDWSKVEDSGGGYRKPSDDQLLSLAKKFYSFVENRR
jgi:hypothetical protein